MSKKKVFIRVLGRPYSRMKKLPSIKELAEYLGVKENTIYSWTHMRQILYYKVGHLLRFDKEEIDKWLEKRKQKVYRYFKL